MRGVETDTVQRGALKASLGPEGDRQMGAGERRQPAGPAGPPPSDQPSDDDAEPRPTCPELGPVPNPSECAECLPGSVPNPSECAECLPGSQGCKLQGSPLNFHRYPETWACPALGGHSGGPPGLGGGCPAMLK